MSERKIGIIGGSGLYEMEGLEEQERIEVQTPFGEPSNTILSGKLGDARLYFLPRHGQGHRILPHEINYRANIWALKKLAVEWILSVSAVGSLKEEIVPGHLVVVDQFIDRTRARPSTFFGNGIAAHVQFGDPICPELADALYTAANATDATVHRGGTYVCINGPQFSTRAESNIYRSWGASVVGMTNIPECKLAREAEICYATLALSTDYDCWHEEEVSVEAVITIIKQNVARAREVLEATIKALPAGRSCGCGQSLKDAVMTRSELIPDQVKRDLAPILGERLG